MSRAAVLEPIGTLIAHRYRIEELLGRGGMAAVYRVRDDRDGKQLALKRCHARDGDKQRRYEALLEREYYTLAQLAHPRIIEVYDYGVDASGPYYTMELLSGTDLQTVDRLPWRQACSVLRDVASALAILHSRSLVHRDVSMRNVHWTPNGTAKLIDFGAMMTMGVAKDIVGTPPFMAPEVLQLQALDARADLFSLGALGFRLLTGRHAFPARRLAELRDVWRSKPPAPATLAPDVPADLNALVLRLLTLDRGGRPRSAAELIDLLRRIADLELEDTALISRAYLTMPTLVGRDSAVLAIRRQMLSLVRGDGGVLALRGMPGAGRSRMLDACALDGKLLGAAVVRADARDASEGEWGVARSLAKQLATLFPRQARDAARVSSGSLGHVLEEFRSEEIHTQTVTGHVPERAVIIRELRDWVLSLAKVQRLVVVVDDVERIDDPSLALLSAIAHKAHRAPILLALAVLDDPKHPPHPTVRLLFELSQAFELAHLTQPQTEALLSSVFGDVPNLPVCALTIHRLSHGNPRAVMELAQHLVDTGRARYEGGSWALPLALDEGDLPRTLAASLLSRLSELGPDARELADALALADEDALILQSYPALTAHADIRRVFHALDELVSARVLVADASSYQFLQRSFLSVVQEAMPAERRRGLHTRIARLLATNGGDLLRRAHHLLAAGMDGEAMQLLSRIDLASQPAPVSLLKTAVERAERMRMPAGLLHRLRMGILMNASLTMDYESYRQVAPVVLQRLEQDSGLRRCQELQDVPESERLTRALAETQQAYQALPEDQRVHPVLEAIRELGRLSGTVPSIAGSVFDLDLLESLPTLRPLFPLSPSLPLVEQLQQGSNEWVRGRTLRSRAIYLNVLERISAPDRGGLDEVQYPRVRLGIEFAVAVVEASYGIEAVEARARVLEQHRATRVNAWRIRSLLQLAIGDAAEAEKSRRRAALLEAQEGLHARYMNSTAGVETILRSRLGDLLGVKAQLDTLSALAAQHTGWRALEFLGRSRYCELQGDLATALELTLAGLEFAPALRHPFFNALASSHLSLLVGLGRLDEAVPLARHYASLCAREELTIPDAGPRAALVLAAAGHCDEAVEVLTPWLEQCESLGRAGFACSQIYEARARIAMAAGDAETFKECAMRCARELEKANNPALHAQLARLIDEARERGLLPRETARVMSQSLRPIAPESEYDTIHSRMAECVGEADRARCALTLLLQQTISRLGYLYVARGTELRLMAALPDAPSDESIIAWLERYAHSWSAAAAQAASDASPTASIATQTSTESETGTATGTATNQTADQASLHTYVDAEGRLLEAVLLVPPSNREQLAAILVVEGVTGQRTFLPLELVDAITRELLEHGDAKAWVGA